MADVRIAGVQGAYQAIFPVKCNHDRQLISKLLQGGGSSGVGLEAGSKPEIILAMSLLCKYPGSHLICNGYKDAEYMELVCACSCPPSTSSPRQSILQSCVLEK